MDRARIGALSGLALAAPIGLLLFAVVVGFEPLVAFLQSVLTDDRAQPSLFGRAYMLGGLILLFPAFAVAAWPMVRRGPDGRRHLRLANVAALVVIGGLIVLTWGALAEEVVRCDVLGIPNCD